MRDLETASINDGDPQTRKFTFSQHVRSHMPLLDMPDYLQQEMYGLVDNMKSKFTKS